MIYAEHCHATYNQTDDASVTILVLNEFARFSVKDKSETLSSTIFSHPEFGQSHKYTNYFLIRNTLGILLHKNYIFLEINAEYSL